MEVPFSKDFALFASSGIMITRAIYAFHLTIYFHSQSTINTRMKDLGVNITKIGYNAFKTWLRTPSDKLS